MVEGLKVFMKKKMEVNDLMIILNRELKEIIKYFSEIIVGQEYRDEFFITMLILLEEVRK